MKKNIIFIFILGILLTIFIQFYNYGTGAGDFSAYWSAAHLFITGDNPYDQVAMTSLQQSISTEGYSQGGSSLNVWNPPWLILILAPLGVLPYKIAFLTWFFCNTVVIGIIIIISWQMCAGTQRSRGILITFIAGFLFAETLSYLVIGQITGLVSLGMVLAIWWLDHKVDLLAGAVLLLTLIKPQISFFFLLILMIWILQNRRWKVIIGLIIALSTTLIIFWIIDPSWIKDYFSLISNLPYSSTYTSTFGSFIASIFHINIFYFSALILILLIKPFLHIVRRDGWLTTMNLSLLVSLPLSPYGFSFDQIVILPSIVQVIAWLWNYKLSTKVTVIIIISLMLFYTLDLKMHAIPKLENYWFFIIPIVFLAIYIIPWIMSHKSRNLSY
jgi:hypothetical protein